jgi:hypothetical protein
LRFCLFVFLVGCAHPLLPPPAARDLHQGPATFEDADLRAELIVDGTRALVVELVNKSDAPLDVDWPQLCVIGANHVAAPLGTVGAPSLRPGERVAVRLPIVLPRGKRGRAPIEVVLPTVVRGTPREYHYHVRS